jgi:EAL domain-containing protein (putative c-di-GMP-specific phosphodiesterase class I)
MSAGDLGSEALASLLADEESLCALYQPVINLAGGEVVAQVASLSAKRGARELNPGELFAMARTPAAIALLDRLGRSVALRDAAGWLGSQVLFLRLLPQMLDQPGDVLAGLPDVAREAGVPMRQVVIEVALGGKHELTHLARVFTRCRGGGCQVAVVGVADALTVRQTVSMLAPDFVKLGRELLAGEAAELVAATVQAAHDTGARVVAFGVEDAVEAERARVAGADWGQGWHFGRPVPGSVFAAG